MALELAPRDSLVLVSYENQRASRQEAPGPANRSPTRSWNLLSVVGPPPKLNRTRGLSLLPERPKKDPTYEVTRCKPRGPGTRSNHRPTREGCASTDTVHPVRRHCDP